MQYFSEEHSADVVKQQYENCKNLRLKKIMETLKMKNLLHIRLPNQIANIVHPSPSSTIICQP